MVLGKVNEIFRSVQGEGIYCGAEQVFIRLSGCNLSCTYCDTNHHNYTLMTEKQVLKQVTELIANEYIHSVCLTGGEPLLQDVFLEECILLLKKEIKIPIYLETNGVLPRHVNRLIPYLDIVAMDIKIPSSTGERHFWHIHREFLERVRDKDVFVKVVVTESTQEGEFALACELVAQVSSLIPFIIQPESNEKGLIQVKGKKLNQFTIIAKKYLLHVELIQQLHKLAGIK